MCSGHFKSISISFSFVCLHSVFHCIKFHLSIWSTNVYQEIDGALILRGMWFLLEVRKPDAYRTFMAGAFKFFMNPTSIRTRIRCGWEQFYIWSSIFHLQTCSAWYAHATNAFLLLRLLNEWFVRKQNPNFACPIQLQLCLVPGRWQFEIRDSHSLIERHDATSRHAFFS